MHVLGYRCFLICFSLVYIGSQLKWLFSICKLIFHHCFLFLALPGLKVRSFFWICSSCSVFLFGLRCEQGVASFPAFLSTAPLPMLSIYVAVSPKVFFQFILWSLCSLFWRLHFSKVSHSLRVSHFVRFCHFSKHFLLRQSRFSYLVRLWHFSYW